MPRPLRTVARSRILVALVALALPASGARGQAVHPAGHLQTDPIGTGLAPLVTPAFQSDVMVLGTPHLASEGERLRPAHLGSLLDRLAAFAPTRIAIEAIGGDEIALLAEREEHDPAAAQVLDMFARGALRVGRAAQHVLGTDRVTAERRARELLAGEGPITPATRALAAAHLAAAYDLNSAALQWSWLSPGKRAADATLPAEVREALERLLRSANEIVTVAIPLARRVGIQVLDPIDSQYDGIRTLALPSETLEALFGDPDRGALRDTASARAAGRVREAAFAAGDLLPLYVHVNSAAHQAGDQSQWRWLFAERHAGGAGRFRYAMWELRNLRQVSGIVEVASGDGRGAEQVLVLVGSSHKAALERALATQLSVRIVPFE